jgi:sulfite exporter TauE/SafE/copper chaperone CopZ
MNPDQNTVAAPPIQDFQLNVSNMRCSSCEQRIRSALKEMKGVLKQNVDYRSGTVRFTLDTRIAREEDVRSGIEALGYRFSTNKYSRLAGYAIILVALYFLFTKSGLSAIIPEISDSMSYSLLFLVGLLTSVHCLAMCGGISMYQSIDNEITATAPSVRAMKPALLYNAGRVTSYTLIGGIVGLLGSVFSVSVRIQATIFVVAGVVMFFLGLRMLDVFPWLKKLSLRLPSRIPLKRSGMSPFIVGLLNGFMPCGPLQSMQIYALGTGSFFGGAVSMFFFASGTVPLMFGLGAAGSLLVRRFAGKIATVSALLILLLSALMIGHGMNLAGFSAPALSGGSSNIAVAKAGMQFVSSSAGPNSYEPIIIQRGSPVTWTISVSASDLNGCNSTLTVPAFDIRRKLQPGENIIEFMPEQSGSIVFTCWMGMISSVIKVVDDMSVYSEKDVESIEIGYLVLNEDLSIDPSKISFAELDGSKQSIYTDVSMDELTPPILVVQRGIETEWILNGKEINRDNNFIYFPEYDAGFVLADSNTQPKSFDLVEGENKLTIMPQKDFMFKCRNGEVGFVKVVDDLAEIDMERLVRDIQTFAPTLGCCIVQYE